MNLYRHFDKDGRLLYVGVSLSALSRLAQHRDASHWFQEIASVKIEVFEDRKAALAAERDAIVKENPLHNLKRPTSKEVEASKGAGESGRALLRRLVQFNPTYSMMEAGNALGISTTTLKKLIDAGEVGFIQIGSKRRITGWQLIEFLDATTEKPSAQSHKLSHKSSAACFEPERTFPNRNIELNARQTSGL